MAVSVLFLYFFFFNFFDPGFYCLFVCLFVFVVVAVVLFNFVLVFCFLNQVQYNTSIASHVCLQYICYDFKDTLKAYFCQRYTLFKSTICVGYFIYFKFTRVSSIAVCVYVYTLPPVGFFRLHDVCDIEMYGSTIFFCEYYQGLLPSSFISVSESIIFHLPKRKLQPTAYWRENDMI